MEIVPKFVKGPISNSLFFPEETGSIGQFSWTKVYAPRDQNQLGRVEFVNSGLTRQG